MRPEIGPVEASEQPELRIVDIRTRVERLDGIGFIPGSVWIPEEEIRADPGVLVRGAPSARVVLACQSGRRSGALVDDLRQRGVRGLLNLSGGVLEWSTHQLPLCLPEGAEDVELTPKDFRRRVLSCFVAEAVQVLDEDADDFDEIDPVGTVEAVFDTQLPRWTADGARRALDLLSETARVNGHSLATIAGNVAHFYQLADRVTPEHDLDEPDTDMG